MASGWRPQPDIVRQLFADQGVPKERLEVTTRLFMRWAEECDSVHVFVGPERHERQVERIGTGAHKDGNDGI